MKRSVFLSVLCVRSLVLACGRPGGQPTPTAQPREPASSAAVKAPKELALLNVSYVQRGRASVAPALDMAYPEYQHLEARNADVYVRPHELVIERDQTSSASLRAKVVHVNPAGSRTKVELQLLDSELLVNAEVTAERFAELSLKSGDTVHVSPRRVPVFMPEQARA